MSDFVTEYNRLNKAQKQAVDLIDGPVLVIAGPGTGKTQLLSARVANILQKTDTLPSNILCLTFTESGAQNMRDRLTRFIGQAAYEVGINTYHAFGRELITRFPEYFTETRLQTPIDNLGKHQLLQKIVNGLSYSNPLKQLEHHLGDLISTIGEVKRALLDSKDLLAIADENTEFISSVNKDITHIFGDFARMPTKLEPALHFFTQTLEVLQKFAPTKSVNRFGSLSHIATKELESAIEEAIAIDKAKPLTKWKNDWLAKNSSSQFVLSGELPNKRLVALAGVLEEYKTALTKNGWYDFDDMITRSIETLEKNPDLRFTLQEQYLYLLLDEFQDTNAVQLKLVELLTENPVNEGRPNVMAVGDDDQAIYAFQGAQYSNMLSYYNMYKDVALINLTENYRSHSDILHTAHNIVSQINSNLQSQFEGISKTLTAARKDLQAAKITRNEFLSDVEQNDWISTQISSLIRKGTDPSEIAVLAPTHKYLTALVPYLNSKAIPVRYEKREDILQTKIVKELIAMSKLVIALAANDTETANALWVEVLSFDFWKIPVSDIWKLSWKVNDTDKSDNLSWSKLLLDEPKFREPALLFLTLAGKVTNETCENMLDYLIGTEALNTNISGIETVRSPLRAFYTSSAVQESQPEVFYETISNLIVLRAKLHKHQATKETVLRLVDLISFVNMYEAADERMTNSSPYNQQVSAVQLMTVFKAKGLEFEHVFLLSLQDEVWGNSTRGKSNKLTLPVNLAPIRHAGASEDERLRILFVAITRAKFGLYLTTNTENYDGRSTKRLKYLDEQEQPDGSHKALVLPEHTQTVEKHTGHAPALQTLELDWHEHHLKGIAVSQLKGLLKERLESYRLSPTHLNTFIDMEYGGPEKFFFNTLLRFPQAPNINGQFGSAIHDTLEWVQHQVNEQGSVPAIHSVTKFFSTCMKAHKLTPEQTTLEIERGTQALTAYILKKQTMFKPGDKPEYSFKNEGVFIGDAHLNGKIDRMEIDKTNKTIVVVDYKTSKNFNKWGSSAKLHKYKQQLYCYKLLVEGSHTFRGYEVIKGRLEFIEPDPDGAINTLELDFEKDELEKTKQLLQIMWQHVMQLKFPSTATYKPTYVGIRKFEQDLLDGNV